MFKFKTVPRRVASAGFLWLCGTGFVLAQEAAGTLTNLSDLSSFREPGKSWKIAGNVTADFGKSGSLRTSDGTGVLVNLPDKKNPGADLFTNLQHGDAEIELDYMMAKGSNSGIYLQGRYEVQLHDSWGVKTPSSGNNGGIYERWDDTRPEGRKGYEGYAPRQNVSRAPGLWQHIKISFQAPRFDASGKKIENAVIRRIELNGVVIHENVELLGPTRGAVSAEEAATGPLRLQGDHGQVAFKNLKISTTLPAPVAERPSRNNFADPILVDASVNTILRSFMDLDGGIRVVHAVSAGSADQVHYTYDMDKGNVVQLWRGGFLDATPMWDGRGNGTSRPLGSVIRFGKPVFSVAKLASPDAAWPQDTVGSGYRPKGYMVDEADRPSFRYLVYGTTVNDASRVAAEREGITREISIQNPTADMYVRIAEADAFQQIADGLYVAGDRSYYVRLDETGGAKAIVRDQNGKKELLLPARAKVIYSILF